MIQNNLFLNGLQALPFNLVPAQLYLEIKDPTAANYTTRPYKTFQIGTFWLNTINQNLWYLANIVTSPKKEGNWVLLSGGISNVETLTSNSGGAISPLVNNINVVGDGTTITGVGVAGTHTITFSTVGTGVASTLTGNSGGAVSPTAGNINVVGSGVITVVGNPGTSTLTVTPSGAISSSFVTQAGTATPALGVLTINGSGVISTSGAGSTVTITPSGTIGSSFPTDSGTAVPSAGVLNIIAGNSTLNCGSSVKFSGATNVVTLNVTDAGGNTIIGKNSGNLTLTAPGQVGVGTGVFVSLTTAGSQSNTAMGYNSMNAATTAGLCSAFGANSLLANVSSPSNCAFGESNMSTLLSGTGQNTSMGYHAMDGGGAGTFQQCSSIGYGSLTNTTTSIASIGLGYNSGTAYTTENYNIILGSCTGTAGQSNEMRLGHDATVAGAIVTNKTYISGVRGITTTAADAIAVLISSTGQLGTISSSRRFKNSISDMSEDSSNIMKLRPVSFEFNDGKPGVKQYGLIAEEVEETFPYLTAKDQNGLPFSVKYHEMPSLLLNELIKLEKRVKELEERFL